MSNDIAATLFNRLNVNVNALGSAIAEISVWIEQRGATNTSEQITAYLQVLAENHEYIADKIVELRAYGGPENEISE